MPGPGQEDRLAAEIEALIGADATYRARKAAVLSHQARLQRLVSDRAWQTYLKLEEAQVARWYRALIVIARRNRGRARR